VETHDRILETQIGTVPGRKSAWDLPHCTGFWTRLISTIVMAHGHAVPQVH